MVLAKDVKGPDGSVAISSGTTVDESVMDKLDMLGAGYVFIKPGDADLDQELTFRRVEEHVRKFFQYVDPDLDAFLELFRISMEKTWTEVENGWDLPCESELTAQNVEHMRDLFFKGRATVEDLVKHETSLASFPDIYFKIKQVLDSPTSSADDIAKVVSADPAMSTKLLKLVNSPVFGFATKIDSVPHAVSLAGTNEIATLALGISAINYFKGIPTELIDMKVFWRHSLSCAVFAKLLATALGLPSDRFFTAGLLHDTGKLIMYKNMPYASVQALIYARSNIVPLVEAEEEVLDFTHCDVAQSLLDQWDFPTDLESLIIHHHNPMQAKDRKGAAVIQLADNMANAVAISSGGMFVLPGMDEGAWDLLGLNPNELGAMVAMHDRNIDAITSAFT